MPRRGEETKALLVNAFWNLLETNPLDKVTVTALTKASQVNRQTFYYHFENINVFLLNAYHSILKDCFSAIRSISDPKQALAICFDVLEGYRGALTSLASSKDYLWIRRDMLTYTSKFLLLRYNDKLDEAGVSDQNKGFFSRMYSLLIFEFVERWLSNRAFSTTDSFGHSIEFFLGAYLK